MKLVPKRNEDVWRRSGLTVTELLVTVVVISVLSGLLLSAIQVARGSARDLSCRNKLRQMAISAQLYESVHRSLPANSLGDRSGSLGSDYLYDRGFLSQLLPFAEYRVLAEQWDSQTFSFDGVNGRLAGNPIGLMECPSSPWVGGFPLVATRINGPVSNLGAYPSDFVVNTGVVDYVDGVPDRHREGVGRTVLYHKSGGLGVAFADVHDGMSNSFLLWESVGARRVFRYDEGSVVISSWYDSFSTGYAIGPIWGAGSLSTIRIDNSATYVGYIQAWAGFRPGTIVFRKGGGGESGTRVNSGNDLGQPFGFHFQHANFVLVDGSVHPMSYATDSKVLRAMATIAGSDD